MHIHTYIYTYNLLQFACKVERHSKIEERRHVHQMGLAAADAEPMRGILTVVVKFRVINTSGKGFDIKNNKLNILFISP